MAGEGVSGLLDHKGLLVEVEGFLWSASSSFFARWFCFSNGSYSYPCASSGTLMRSFSLSLGNDDRGIPARIAARLFSFRPPIGRTSPRKVISPVIATSGDSGCLRGVATPANVRTRCRTGEIYSFMIRKSVTDSCAPKGLAFWWSIFWIVSLKAQRTKKFCAVTPLSNPNISGPPSHTPPNSRTRRLFFSAKGALSIQPGATP